MNDNHATSGMASIPLGVLVALLVVFVALVVAFVVLTLTGHTGEAGALLAFGTPTVAAIVLGAGFGKKLAENTETTNATADTVAKLANGEMEAKIKRVVGAELVAHAARTQAEEDRKARAAGDVREPGTGWGKRP